MGGIFSDSFHSRVPSDQIRFSSMWLFPDWQDKSLNSLPLSIGRHWDVQFPQCPVWGWKPPHHAPLGQSMAASGYVHLLWLALLDPVCPIPRTSVRHRSPQPERMAFGVDRCFTSNNHRWNTQAHRKMYEWVAVFECEQTFKAQGWVMAYNLSWVLLPSFFWICGG